MNNAVSMLYRLAIPRRALPARRAATIVELLIALTVTAFVALGVATVLQAASYGTSSKRDLRRLAVRSQQVRSRIEDTVRAARTVLTCGTDSGGNKYLVLWRGDTNATDTNKGKVNLSELQMLEWNAATFTLSSYAAASAPAPDTTYAVTADFRAAALALPATVWATNVSSFSVTLDAAPPQTHLVTWSATLASELLSDSLTAAASLREWGAPD